MVDGYDSADANQNIPPELDDYICDYVDGSMDPVVRVAFEEFLEANPNVRRHVDRVADTAALLRSHGRCLCAPDGFDSRLRCAVEHECLAEGGVFSGETISRLGGIVLSGSTIAIVCLSMLVLAYDGGEPDATIATSSVFEMFGAEAQPVEGAATAAQPATRSWSAPDRNALQRASFAPYTPVYLGQAGPNNSPFKPFPSVQRAPVLVLYP